MKYFKKSSTYKSINILAFTLIELIIVATIIILISSTSVFYFWDFVDTQKLKSEISSFQNKINSLDADIRLRKIYDYELNLKVWSWSYIVYKNIFDLDNVARLDFQSWTGIIDIRPIVDAPWQFKIYNDYKLLKEDFLNATGSLSYFLWDYKNYTFKSFLSWSILNDIELNYFSNDNLYLSKEWNLYISEINSKLDKTWTGITDLIIKNISWRKKLIWDWINYDKAYVFFDWLWTEEYLELYNN